MALVKEFKAPNGATVRIFDDCYAGVSDEEMARRYARRDEVVEQVAYNIAKRRFELLTPEEQEALRHGIDPSPERMKEIDALYDARMKATNYRWTLK